MGHRSTGTEEAFRRAARKWLACFPSPKILQGFLPWQWTLVLPWKAAPQPLAGEGRAEEMSGDT